MINNTTSSQPQSFTEVWPVGSGLLPRSLFSDDHLYEIIFDCFPRSSKFSQPTIRQGLKTHLKRNAPEYRIAGNDQKARDISCASLFCNLSSSRERASDLVFIVRKNRGPGGRRGTPFKYKVSFANIILNSYGEKQELKELFNWIMAGARKNQQFGNERYHTSATLERAFKEGNCPVDLDDLWLSRFIILFSSLLPEVDRLDLLRTAGNHGCQPIIDAYFEAAHSASLEESNSDHPRSDRLTLRNDKLPEFSSVKEITFRSWDASEDIKKQAADLVKAEHDMREKRDSAETALQNISGSLLDCSQDKWSVIINQIETARKAISDFAVLQTASKAQCQEKLATLLLRLKSPLPSVFPEIEDTTDKLAATLRDIDAINSGINELRPSTIALAIWRNEFAVTTTVNSLWNLIKLAEKEAYDKKNRQKFCEEVNDYCRDTDTDDIVTFLTSLDSSALFAIITQLSEGPWVPAGAILLSIALAKVREISSDALLSTMPISRLTRRAFLRFINPNSHIFRGADNFQRLIIVERLRDAWTFGPLAQISDLTAGEGNVALTGRRVSDLIDLIVSNLDILSSGSDLVRMLRPFRRDEAQQRLVEFINTPVTLKGNFRRLREIAREQLLLPLLARKTLSVDSVEKLVTLITSGQAAKDIVAEFSEARPDSRLEARHHEQLTRYLDLATDFLNDFLSELVKEPDGRQKSFISALRKIRDSLQIEGALGSVEWLEAEIRIILEGQSYPGDDQPTLIGDARSALFRHWNDADRDWASSFIDLPEFHGETTLQPIEVAATILRWKSRDLLPQPIDIADYLTKRQNFSQALRIAEDANDHETEEFVRKSCLTIVATLQRRCDAILLEYRQYPDCPVPDRQDFDTALTHLDIKEVEEILALWELTLKEEESKTAAKVKAATEKERKESLLILLQKAGVSDFDITTPTATLTGIWQDILTDRSEERAHLEAVSYVFQKCETLQPDLVEKLVSFSENVTDPTLWLPPSLASDLLVPVNAIAVKISDWVTHSVSFRDEEKSAVISLVSWFLDLVIERSVLFNEEGSGTAVASALDHLLDMSIAITSAAKPSECLALLTDRGEMEVLDIDVTKDINYDKLKSISFALPQETAQSPVRDVLQGDVPLAQALVEAIKNQDWSSALQICESGTKYANSEQAIRLVTIKRAITPLTDYSVLPSHEIAEMLPASAAWLSSQSDGVSQLSDTAIGKLAYHLLSGAIAVDSVQEMARSSSPNGGWTELLRASSPFRRMLTTSLPSFTGKVIEALISGHRGLVFAEKLWDAATNLSEPQNYRAPLLNLLNDSNAHEIIIKLAGRHDPAIVSRLSQLFELRAVAQNRPDLLPVAQSVADQVAVHAKPGPFRVFVKGLPSAVQFVTPTLHAVVEGAVQLRLMNENKIPLEIPIIVTPEGLVPTTLLAHLFEEDDVTFEDESRVKILSNTPIYFPSDYTVALRFGCSWFGADAASRDSVRIRIQAKTVTNHVFQEDIICIIRKIDRSRGPITRIDTDTLLDIYPGVSNTPVVDEAFIGRVDELERLQQVLVAAPNPSPVLLTGMRRIGKTSLLYAFHQRFSASSVSRAISVYQSLAERRVEFASPDHSVSWTFFKAISHGLVRPNVPARDRNYALCTRVRERFGNDWKGARKAIFDCYDEESLSDSLMVLADRLREWSGWNSRFIFLIDEAEALVAAYQAGGRKKLELEQLLQSLREVSQNTGGIGLLLSGSNHINMFSREYKNAFFGSSQTIELEGFADAKTAGRIIAPERIENYIKFEDSAISYAWELCAGMPQFLWQIGATTSFQIKSGIATQNDIRSAVAMLVSPARTQLPFKAYEMLEPIDSMLSLEAPRERDLLWMLLYRIAQASSLAAPNAAIPVAIDQSLLTADDQTSWRRRLRTLVDLKVLRMDSEASVRFQVPLFAESFRASKNMQEFNIRQQQVAI